MIKGCKPDQINNMSMASRVHNEGHIDRLSSGTSIHVETIKVCTIE